MDIFAKTALCVLVSTSLIACGGGGGGDSAGSNTPNNTTTLTTPEEVAKAAAAYYVANRAFGYSMSMASHRIRLNASTTVATVDVPCNSFASIPTFRVTANTSTLHPNDGTLSHSTECPHGDYVVRGQLSETCNDVACNSSKLVANDFVQGLAATSFYPIINGTFDHTFASGFNKDIYKGSVRLEKGGLVTTFSFPDGLARDTPMQIGGSTIGKITVSGGNALNCTTDGEVNYQELLSLTSTSGTLRVNKGSVEAGAVTFQADGSVKVKMAGQVSETTITKSTFESYCGVKEINEWRSKNAGE